MIPRRVVRQRGSGKSRKANNVDFPGPFRPLPPLINNTSGASNFNNSNKNNNSNNFYSTNNIEPTTLELLDTTTIDSTHREKLLRASNNTNNKGDDNSTSSTQSSRNNESSSDCNDQLPLVHLPPVTRPVDLTTDHSAYNPVEVMAVLRRCNNAPRVISSGLGGGIKRVAGNLAVTRALGDAYLKTPLLSFNPYKSHAPYITARPEVNCRPLVKGLDNVLILATDGVWERASGEDVLRWVRNFYEERVAEAERRNNRRQNNNDNTAQFMDNNKAATTATLMADANDNNETPDGDIKSCSRFTHEAEERDLFETTTTVCDSVDRGSKCYRSLWFSFMFVYSFTLTYLTAVRPTMFFYKDWPYDTTTQNLLC
jgi:hypothetical protein